MDGSYAGGDGSGSDGGLTLRVATNPDADIMDINGVDAPGGSSTTEVLTAGAFVFGTASGADHDWYRVDLVAGQVYASATESIGGTGADPYLSLRDSSGAEVAFDDDSGPGQDSLIHYTAALSGTYYLDVSQFGGTGSVSYAALMAQQINAPDQAAGSTATTATLAVGAAVNGVIETFDDTDWYAVTLTAGQRYLFTLDAAGSPSLGDPYLALYGASGATVLAFDDDGGTGTNSALRYTATSTGTYYISAEAYSIETGGYHLALSAIPPQDPLKTIDWGSQVANTSVRIYFANSGETYSGFTATASWSADQIAAVMAVGGAYSAVANLTFVQTSSAAAAGMVMVLDSNIGAGIAGQMSTPPAAPTVGVFQPSYLIGTELQSGGEGFALLMHEMGHGLGLAHPHDGGGTSEVMDGVSGPFNSYGTAGLNQGVFTIMTYNDGYPSQSGGTPSTSHSGYQSTPMALDIAVLQQKYGAVAQNAGDTVYSITQIFNRYASIWDTGGVDTISGAGNGNRLIIDLRAATLLNQDGGGGYVTRYLNLQGNQGGYTIAAGVQIENAIGGTSDDRITGNALANILRGGLGDDTLDGGGNVDRAIFSGARSAYTVTHTGGTATVSGTDGTDTLTNVEFFQFDDQTVHFRAGVGTAINFTTASPSTYMGAIRDFDGNDLGSVSGWLRIGQADIQGDGDIEQILVNRLNGRWASVGPAEDGLVYFDDHGWAGDTRVVGIYTDPLVANGTVVAGSDNDSQRRFQNDLNIENIHAVLGAGDYDHDGLQEVYFSLTDGTAYLHAYMHADGNIRYANYQSQQQVIDYLTTNGFSSTTWAGWFDHAGAGLDGADHLISF